MDDNPTTEELRISQLRREGSERREAENAGSDPEVEQHERRAEKAAYLKRKLEEREEAERRAGA